MKKFIAVLFIILLLTSCSNLAGAKDSVSLTSSDAANSTLSSSDEGSLSSSVDKNDTYYNSLLKQVDFDHLYFKSENKTLEAQMAVVAASCDIILYNAQFDNVDQLTPTQLFLLARSEFTQEEWNETDKTIKDDNTSLYKSEWIEKYIYALFDYKIDLTQIPGYSEKEGGVRYVEEGFGGGGEKKILSFNKTSDNTYNEIIRFYEYPDNQKGTEYTDKECVFSTDGQRIMIVSMKNM